MASGISYENYQFTERDRYRKIRDGNADVSFSYLANCVAVDLDKRELAIAVDEHFNDMVDFLEKDESPKKKKAQALLFAIRRGGMCITHR